MHLKVGDVLLIETNMRCGREHRTAVVSEVLEDRFVFRPLYNVKFTQKVGGIADSGYGTIPRTFSPNPSGYGVRSVRVVGRMTQSGTPVAVNGETYA